MKEFNIDNLIHELTYDTYVKLKPSNIHGVGVFAIKDIPENVNPFGTEPLEDWIQLEKEQFNILPEEIKNLIETYCTKEEGKYWVPKYGFKGRWGIASFLNHSNNPNVISINNGNTFKTIKKINKGDELLINYNDITEEDNNFN